MPAANEESVEEDRCSIHFIRVFTRGQLAEVAFGRVGQGMDQTGSTELSSCAYGGSRHAVSHAGGATPAVCYCLGRL